MKNSLILLVLFVSACKADDSDYKFVKLEDFEYEKASLKENAEIEVFSFSGGRECTGTIKYFYQYIGIDKATGDTVRILTPCQTIDKNIKPTTGTFATWDKGEEIIIDALTQQGKTELLGDKGVVVFNKRQLAIEERNFKTAIGTLTFNSAGK